MSREPENKPWLRELLSIVTSTVQFLNGGETARRGLQVPELCPSARGVSTGRLGKGFLFRPLLFPTVAVTHLVNDILMASLCTVPSDTQGSNQRNIEISTSYEPKTTVTTKFDHGPRRRAYCSLSIDKVATLAMPSKKKLVPLQM